ncbi:insulinase family protein [Clostridium sp. Marseille-Q2269]|uniref:insulinase family protein n=1 Tax=Clostridium sp. Marseille-Q2269 TaxID=2942205 RepID=UPI002073BE5E|nr:insulinase family protein [Clostridium sp. Marseille-Q2269]
MELTLNRLEKKSSNQYLYKIDEDVIVMKYLIPVGYKSKNISCGYAHLLEHMYINSNYSYLKDIEKKGVRFNATTTENLIEITLIDATGKLLLDKLKDVHKDMFLYSTFNEKQLQLEKKTILQEHNILKKTLGTKNADFMIGTEKDIDSFYVDKLNKYSKVIRDKNIKIIFSSLSISENTGNKENINKKCNWIDHIMILNITNYKGETHILLEDNCSGRILFYSLHIFFDEILKLGSPSYNTKHNKFEIILPVEYDLFKEYVLKYKMNSLIRYKLKTNISFKFLCDEVRNIINLIYVPYGDCTFIDESFYLKNWEKVIGEYANE